MQDDPVTHHGHTPTYAGHFHPTRWSLVQAAGRKASHEADAALEELCRAYWPPIYAEIRRRGHGVTDAQDLTQDFFARLLHSEAFGRADKEKGRFRSYILAALDFFLTDQYRGRVAAKRGGGAEVLSLDAEEGESWVREQAGSDVTPAQAFDHRWAMILMNRAFAALKEQYAKGGRAEVFEQLQPYLAAESGSDGYAQAAESAGMTEQAFSVAVHRLRQRFRECLREEVAATVLDPAEAGDEMKHLFGM